MSRDNEMPWQKWDREHSGCYGDEFMHEDDVDFGGEQRPRDSDENPQRCDMCGSLMSAKDDNKVFDYMMKADMYERLCREGVRLVGSGDDFVREVQDVWRKWRDMIKDMHEGSEDASS